MAQVQPNTEEGEKMADGGILLQGESSEALKRGWSATITTIGRGWIYFMVLVFVITFPAAIVGAYGAARHALLAATAVPIAIFCWVLFVQLVQSSVCLADRLPSRRKQPSQVFLDALRSAVTVAIVVLASVLALAFLIIPGVFVFGRLSLALVYTLREGLDPLGSIRSSWLRTRGKTTAVWRVIAGATMAAGTCGVLLTAALALVLGRGSLDQFAETLASWLFYLLTTAVMIIGSVWIQTSLAFIVADHDKPD